LNSNPDRKLTLLSAPAGFGKTTLIVEWLNTINLPATWYSKDASDNDPNQFITYLINALQRIYPNLGVSILAASQSLQSPDIGDNLFQLINEIAAIERRGVLILDDFHFIEHSNWRGRLRVYRNANTLRCIT